MAPRALRRRTITGAGVYTATVFGFAISIVATRILGSDDYGRYASVMAIVGFFQLLLDLTIDEALIKFGLRYSTAGDWGRLRRLFEISLAIKVLGGALAAVVIAGLAAFSSQSLAAPLLVGSLIPLAQSAETIAGGILMVRGRYDVRGVFFSLAMGLRLLGTGIGALYGVTWAVAGFLFAQVVSTTAIGVVALVAYRRFPRSASRPLAEDARDVRTFLVQSTVASSLTSMRGVLGTALMPIVATTKQAGYFRNAQAPLTAFGALSSPARLVMLAEQTADYERGERGRVVRALVRYSGATTLLMLVAVPVGWILMPWLMQLAYGHDFRVHATDAARLVLIAGALQLIFGWSKTLPVTVGRPALRIWTHAIEVAVFVPLVVILGSLWGATGAALALLLSTIAFCAAWGFLFLQIRHRIHEGTA